MASQLPPLDPALLEPLAHTLGEAATGSQLSRLFAQVDLPDVMGDSGTKWKRIYHAMESDQKRPGSANRSLAFTKAVLAPARFVSRGEEFEFLREEANSTLAFAGYHLNSDGRLAKTRPATTISEAQERASKLKSELANRSVHPDVFHFCRAELIVPNYFHAVFEATKSVADKIRKRTGLTGDGSELVDAAFGLGKSGVPLLAFNTLQSETERSEQKGLAMLFKGMFGTFRNVTAHAPKVTWSISEGDAFDLLTLASFLHRRLDNAALTRPVSSHGQGS